MVYIESDDKWKFVDEKSSYKVKSYTDSSLAPAKLAVRINKNHYFCQFFTNCQPSAKILLSTATKSVQNIVINSQE